MCVIYKCRSSDEQNKNLENKRKMGFSIFEINKDGEYATQQYVVDFAEYNLSIGINTDGALGIDVGKIYHSKERILIGYDCTLVWLATRPVVEIVKEHKFTSYFFEFMPLDNTDEVIVISEIEVARINIFGDVIWSIYAADIITYFNIIGSFLYLQFFEDTIENMKVDLLTGKVEKLGTRPHLDAGYYDNNKED